MPRPHAVRRADLGALLRFRQCSVRADIVDAEPVEAEIGGIEPHPVRAEQRRVDVRALLPVCAVKANAGVLHKGGFAADAAVGVQRPDQKAPAAVIRGGEVFPVGPDRDMAHIAAHSVDAV